MSRKDQIIELINSYSITLTVPSFVQELASEEELAELEVIARKHAKAIIAESVEYLADQLNKPRLTVIK